MSEFVAALEEYASLREEHQGPRAPDVVPEVGRARDRVMELYAKRGDVTNDDVAQALRAYYDLLPSDPDPVADEWLVAAIRRVLTRHTPSERGTGEGE